MSRHQNSHWLRSAVLAAALGTTACSVDGLLLSPALTGALKGASPAPGESAKPTATAASTAPGARPSTGPAGHVEGDGHTHPSTAPTTGATTSPVVPAGIAADVPELYKRLYGASAVSLDGDYVVVVTTALPDHGTPYYTGTEWADRGTEFLGEAEFRKSPSTIASTGSFTFRLPLHPTEDAAHTATKLGAIGVSLNGVPFFNQYNKDNEPLSGEIISWDQHLGHPNQDGTYHYHTVPPFLTEKFGEDAFLGFLLDGYPVYGPLEGDKTLTSADLDAYHGHVGETPEFPTGSYHYHVTYDAPYINGTGYFGKPGTVTDTIVRGGPGGTQQPPTGGTTGGTQPPPTGGTTGGTGTQPPTPTAGNLTFSLSGSYAANEYPVKVELTPPDMMRTVATLVFNAPGAKVSFNLPVAGHYMFVTTNGGTRTNKGWLAIAPGTTAEVVMPLPAGSTATAPSGPPAGGPQPPRQ